MRNKSLLVMLLVFGVIGVIALGLSFADTTNSTLDLASVRLRGGSITECRDADAANENVLFFNNQQCGTLKVNNTSPAVGAKNVDVQTGFNIALSKPIGADLKVADIEITAVPIDGGTELKGKDITLDLTRQSLSFLLDAAMKENTGYAIAVSGLMADDGSEIIRYMYAYTTGSNQPQTGGLAYNEVGSGIALKGATSVLYSEQYNVLYISEQGGTIKKATLDQAGKIVGGLTTLFSNSNYTIIGLAEDPDPSRGIWATVWDQSNKTVYNSHVSHFSFGDGQGLVETKVITGIERHPGGDHGPTALSFKGSNLYVALAGLTHGGGQTPSYWGAPIMRESLKSAAIIVVDYSKIDNGNALNMQSFNLTRQSAPARIYATGIRNAYDMTWHSNGKFYANINQNSGSADTQGNAPPVFEKCSSFSATVDTAFAPDTLVQLEDGKYYGHPNPARGECVVLGGGSGPFKVPGYAASVAADPNWVDGLNMFWGSASNRSFGVSVNGIDEFTANTGLKGALLAADFSGSRSILIAKLGSDTTKIVRNGSIDRIQKTNGQAWQFKHPIDITVNPANGKIYVIDFGNFYPETPIGDGSKLHVLEPAQ